MKVNMVIQHVSTGKVWTGDVSEITEAQLEEAKTAIKENLGNLTYVELRETILPADFIRNQCVITFQTE
jgi:hypothetical protein